MKATFQVIAFFTFISNLLNAQTISLSSSTLQVEENLPTNEIVGTITGSHTGTEPRYHLVNGVDMYWSEAKADAITRGGNFGGHLVTITSNDEQLLINQLLRDNNYPTDGPYWIGLIENSTGVDFEWVTGEDYHYEDNYTNWQPSHPESNGGTRAVYLTTSNTSNFGLWYDWRDAPNSRLDGYILEISQPFTFQFHDGDNDNSLFNLDLNGTLTTASTFDYETTPTLTIEVNATDYLGDSVIQTFTVQIQDVPSTSLVENDILVESQNLHTNWYTSEWFGTFYVPTLNTNWIYHIELGWLYLSIDSDDSYWMYLKLQKEGQDMGWVWTTKNSFPYLYHLDETEWIYFLKVQDQPKFYEYENGTWFDVEY